MPDPIPTTLAAQIAAARRHTPGGKLTPEDMAGLIRRTARLCGVTVKDVQAAAQDATHG